MGMEAYQTHVEVHVAGGLPAFTITGLPAAAVRESRDRVRAALQTCGHPVPPSRVTVHLGPADIPKEGGRFDLPIALGVLQVENGWKWPVEEYEFIGELALSGALRPVLGALPAVLAARDAGRAVILPAGNAAEAEELLQEFGLAETGRNGVAARPVATPPARHRATGAWLARMFALEQERRVASSHGRIEEHRLLIEPSARHRAPASGG